MIIFVPTLSSLNIVYLDWSRKVGEYQWEWSFQAYYPSNEATCVW